MADNDLPEDLRPSAKRARKNNYSKIFIIVLAFLVVAGLSFWGGSSYQKSHSGITATTAASNFHNSVARGSYPGEGAYGGFGIVTAISSTSISVQDQRSGTTRTYAITSTTVITDDGSTVTYSDIQDGDRVIVIASSSSSSTAANINVNPSYGGPGGGSQAQGTTGT